MKGEHLSWQRRWQAHMARERAFLPKRLVWFTLLLLLIFSMLLLRTGLWGRPSAFTLVEARLQSKLLADYAVRETPGVALAPLRLALIDAKIRDENPYLSEEEVAGLVQRALTAAQAPIVSATPTPTRLTQSLIKAVVMVNEPTTPFPPMTMSIPLPATGPRSLSTIPTPALTVGALAMLPTIPLTPAAVPSRVDTMGVLTTTAALPPRAARTIQTETVLLSQASPVPLALTPPSPVGAKPSRLPPVIANAPAALPTVATAPTAFVSAPTTQAPPVMPTGTALPVTHWAASQPELAEKPTASAIPTLPAPVTATPTSWANATWSATTTPTPTTDWTATVLALVETPTEAAPLPTNTPIATTPLPWTPTMLPTWTATWTVTPSAIPTATSTVTPTVTPTETPSVTPTVMPTETPSVTPTLPPAPTASPTSTATPAAPLVITLTAQVENDMVYLSWQPSSAADIVGYNLFRSSVGASGLGYRVNANLLSELSYVDTITPDGSQYSYVVTAVSQLSQEAASSQAVAVQSPDDTPPGTPINLAVLLVGKQSQLHWQANQEPDLAGYNLYRSNHLPIDRTQGPLNGATLVLTPAYQDTSLLKGQLYYYVVTALDLAGNESLPSIAAAMSTFNVELPAPPNALH